LAITDPFLLHLLETEHWALTHTEVPPPPRALLHSSINTLSLFLFFSLSNNSKRFGSVYIQTLFLFSASSFVTAMVSLPTLFLLTAAIAAAVFLRRAFNRRKFRLPPGSYGLPFIGETLQLISAYKSANPEPFMDERVRRYGSIFMTHVFGEPTVFSADPELNRFILQNEGKLLDCSYPGSISNLLGKHSLLLMKGTLHKRMHSLTMSFANSSIIKDHLLHHIDRLIGLNLDTWSDRVTLMDQAKKVKYLQRNMRI